MKKPTKKNKPSASSKFSYILKKHFNLDYTDNDLKNALENMGISDIVSLDIAIENKDINSIKEIFNKTIQLEYTIPNRANLPSAAQNRPSVSTSKTTTKPIGSLNSTEFNAQQKLDTEKEKKDQELQNEIKSKEEELETIKRLAGIK
jgi:hypothetical protein